MTKPQFPLDDMEDNVLSLYPQTLTSLELGDKTNARNSLKRVIEKYLQSDQAQLAKRKLETIKKI